MLLKYLFVALAPLTAHGKANPPPLTRSQHITDAAGAISVISKASTSGPTSTESLITPGTSTGDAEEVPNAEVDSGNLLLSLIRLLSPTPQEPTAAKSAKVSLTTPVKQVGYPLETSGDDGTLKLSTAAIYSSSGYGSASISSPIPKLIPISSFLPVQPLPGSYTFSATTSTELAAALEPGSVTSGLPAASTQGDVTITVVPSILSRLGLVQAPAAASAIAQPTLTVLTPEGSDLKSFGCTCTPNLSAGDFPTSTNPSALGETPVSPIETSALGIFPTQSDEYVTITTVVTVTWTGPENFTYADNCCGTIWA